MKTTFVLLLLLTMAVLVCSISYDNGGTSTNTLGKYFYQILAYDLQYF